MKGLFARRVGIAMAVLGMALTASAQGLPGPMGGPGGMPGMEGPGMGGPGMPGHRPPFERAFGGHGIEGRWWNNPKIVERLKLTDDQRKAFDEILLNHREKLIDLRANVEKAELSMEPLVQSDQPNEGAILAQIDKLAQARAELEKANARYLLALRSKLTPEQWKQVQEFRSNRDREGWGHRPDGPGDERGPRLRGPRDGNGKALPPPGAQGMLDDESLPVLPPEPGAGMPQ